MANPLKQYARTPKVYIKLPTLSKFYPSDLLQYSPNGEIGIKGLTAADDMMLNNTDALLNGDAVFHVLKSCLVDCKDVKKLLYPDVNTILTAIRAASKGDKMKFTAICPHCEKEHEHEVSIAQLLSATVTIDNIEENTIYEFESGEARLKILMKPSPYTDMSHANLLVYEQARLVQYFRNNNETTDEETSKRLKEAFDKIIKFQQKVLINSIEKIDIIQNSNGEDVVTAVTDRGHISEFLIDLEDEHAKNLNKQLEVLNQNIGTPDNIETQCECGEEFTMEVKFDPTNFSEDNFLVEAAKT